MIGLLYNVVKDVIGLGADHLKGKREIKRLEKEGQIAQRKRVIDGEIKWDEIQAQNANNSWKDEWFTLVLSIPLICCFIPSMAPYIEQGFLVLDGCPDYYKGFLAAAISASFGLKELRRWVGK